MRIAGFAWWEMELPSGVVFFDESKAKMLGYKPSDFVHYSHFTDLLHKDDYPKAMKAMKDHMEGKTDFYECTYRIKAHDGSYKKFYDKGQIVQKSDEGEQKIIGIVVNLTDTLLDKK